MTKQQHCRILSDFSSPLLIFFIYFFFMLLFGFLLFPFSSKPIWLERGNPRVRQLPNAMSS
jgi:hypothetical protein